jgi:hypothetical protein
MLSLEDNESDSGIGGHPQTPAEGPNKAPSNDEGTLSC